VYAYTQVRVEKVAHIGLDDNDGANPIVVSGILNKKEGSSMMNKIHLSFFTSTGEKFSRPIPSSSSSSSSTALSAGNNNRALISHNFRVQCNVVERAWASAQAVMDTNTNELYCNVIPARSLPLASPFAPDALTLKVSVSDSASTYSVEDSFHVKFIPRFVVVLDKTSNAPIRNVALSAHQTHRTVSVLFSSPGLIAVPVNCNLISVTNIAPGVYDIDVQPSARSSAFTTAVEFRDSNTGQYENITVLYRTYSDPDYPTSEDQSSSTFAPKKTHSTEGRSPVVYYLLILSVVLIVICAIVLRSLNNKANPMSSYRSSVQPTESFQPTYQPRFSYN